MRFSAVGLVVLVASPLSCGIVAYSTDSLSNGPSLTSTPGPGVGTDGSVATRGDDAGSDATVVGPLPDGGVGPLPDGAPQPDAGTSPDGGSSIGCPANPCPAPQECCYVKKSATSGEWQCQAKCAAGSTDCAGPQQCTSASAPYCCGNVVFGGGSLPNCSIDNVTTSCKASCTTNLGLSCNVTNTMRLCRNSADCASDPQSKNCCTYIGSGVSSVVCVSDLVRDVAGLLCQP